jgi:hypothetical protein
VGLRRDAENVGRRANVVLAVVVGVIALVAVVAGVLAATRHVATYGAGTPQGVVQRYLTAVVDGDTAAAARLLAADSLCNVDDLDRAYVPDGVQVVLRDSKVDGNTARVRVDVEMSTEGPLNTFEYTEEHTFRLTRAGQDWRISGEPWPMYGCTKVD